MANAADKTELDQLKEDLAAVREDIAALTKSYKTSARDAVRDGAERASGKAREGAAYVSEQIEARPLTSMLVAFAAGLTIGKLLDRR